MKIKTKILLIVVILSVSLYLAGTFVTSLIFFGFVQEQEKKDIANKCGNLSNYLQDQVIVLNSKLMDWAKWDDTYRFVNNGKKEYIENNLNVESMRNLDHSFMVFYSIKNGLVYEIYLDIESGELAPFPIKLSTAIYHEFYQSGGAAGSDKACLIKNGSDFYIATATTVTDSLEEQPFNGYMAVGRKIDGDFIGKMNEMSEGSVEIMLLADLDASIAGKLNQQPAGKKGNRILSVAKDRSNMTSYVMFDPAGSFANIALVMKGGRDIYSAGAMQHNWMIALFFALIVLIIFILIRTLDTNVTRPIIRLIKTISGISLADRRVPRLEVNGKGDLAVLGSCINGMLDKIEQDYLMREYTSYHDQLTGLYNRRYFEEAMKRVDTPDNLPLSLIICDLNGLKFTNDAFGHETGDILLVTVADVLKKAGRDHDIVSRWGGDEFTILLPRTGLNDVGVICAGIKDEIANIEINSMRYTMSLGYETKTAVDEDLRALLKHAEDFMYRRKITENLNGRGHAIHAIMSTFKEKNPREREHSNRVSQLCMLISREMGMSDEQVNDMEIAGLVHDIGKIAVSDAIINKRTRLTADEWTELKRHPEIGYRILCASNEMLEIAGHILAHHERWDGSGYPKGLIGGQIPLEARILAVADSYDAITSDRPYKMKMNELQAIEELKRCAGVQFDPEVVSVFVDWVLASRWDGQADGLEPVEMERNKEQAV